MRKNFWLVALCALVLLLPSLLLGQSTNATITGQVTDPSKALIPQAKVTAINNNTNVRYEGVTNDTGTFLITSLPPGEYRIQVEKMGFKSIVKPDVTLHVQDIIELNFEMAVGSASETVTVEGGTPLVNTENAAVSTVIDRQFVENLPLNGRSFNTLLQLTPGVVLAQKTSGFSAGAFSVAGQRSDSNNFTVDGVSANFGTGATISGGGSGTGNAQAFSALGGTSSLVSVEALQEFRVETSSFAPEFGRSPGGQVILTTRSGTNAFHGGLYEYLRNDALDANDWFANSLPTNPHAPERHNDFGGFFGGPIWKDKTFFFASYEGARLRLPTAKTVPVPSQFVRNSAPAAFAPYINAFPQPTGQPASPTAVSAPLVGVYSNSATLDVGSLRIDHTFNSRISIFGRYNDAPSATVVRNASLSELDSTNVNTRTITVGANITLSNRFVNTVRGNFSTQRATFANTRDSFGGAKPIDPALLAGGLPAENVQAVFFLLDVGNLYILGPSGRNHTQQWNFVDDLSWSPGKHMLKFGGDYRALYLDKNPFHDQLQYLVFSTPTFFSNGSALLTPSVATPASFLTHALSLYGQDTWKVSPRLALTYGLRWELNPAPSASATSLASWMNVDNPSQLTLAPAGTLLWHTTFGNFAPRAGIAYSLTSGGDFVLRAGGGVFYDLNDGQAAQLAANFPNFKRGTGAFVTMPLANASPLLPALSSQPPYPSSTQGFSPDLELPRSYQWNVAVEKYFKPRQVISVTYVGQAGRGLLREEALFKPNASFAGDFLLWQNDARSNYNALQVQYRKPLSKRVQALLNYTWSHSLDNSSNDSVILLSNTVISAARDYASSDFDVRHSFSGAVTYSVPAISANRPLSLVTRDWSVATVVVARSGFPFNGVVRTGTPDPGGLAFSRPDLVAGQPIWISDPTVGGGKRLNPSAFQVPSPARQGTEGRNDIRGFGLAQIDLSISRKFPLGDRVNLQFGADAFNLLNHPNFANPKAFVQLGPTFLSSSQMLNQNLQGLNPLFQEGGPRSLQLSLKLSF